MPTGRAGVRLSTEPRHKNALEDAKDGAFYCIRGDASGGDWAIGRLTLRPGLSGRWFFLPGNEVEQHADEFDIGPQVVLPL